MGLCLSCTKKKNNRRSQMSSVRAFVVEISTSPFATNGKSQPGAEKWIITVLEKWTNFENKTVRIPVHTEMLRALQNSLDIQENWNGYHLNVLSPPMDNWEQARELEKYAEKNVNLFEYLECQRLGKRYNKGRPAVPFSPASSSDGTSPSPTPTLSSFGERTETPRQIPPPPPGLLQQLVPYQQDSSVTQQMSASSPAMYGQHQPTGPPSQYQQGYSSLPMPRWNASSLRNGDLDSSSSFQGQSNGDLFWTNNFRGGFLTPSTSTGSDLSSSSLDPPFGQPFRAQPHQSSAPMTQSSSTDSSLNSSNTSGGSIEKSRDGGEKRKNRGEGVKTLANTLVTFDERLKNQSSEILVLKELIVENFALIQKHGTLSQHTQERLTVRLPTTEIEDLENLETVLKTANEGVKNHFMKLILAVGGNTEKEIVEKAWLKVGTPNVLQKLNWMGTIRKDREHVKKTGVKTMIVTELMMEALQNPPPGRKMVTEDMFAEVTKNFLKRQPRSASTPAQKRRNQDQEAHNAAAAAVTARTTAASTTASTVTAPAPLNTTVAPLTPVLTAARPGNNAAPPSPAGNNAAPPTPAGNNTAPPAHVTTVAPDQVTNAAPDGTLVGNAGAPAGINGASAAAVNIAAAPTMAINNTVTSTVINTPLPANAGNTAASDGLLCNQHPPQFYPEQFQHQLHYAPFYCGDPSTGGISQMSQDSALPNQQFQQQFRYAPYPICNPPPGGISQLPQDLEL